MNNTLCPIYIVLLGCLSPSTGPTSHKAASTELHQQEACIPRAGVDPHVSPTGCWQGTIWVPGTGVGIFSALVCVSEIDSQGLP